MKLSREQIIESMKNRLVARGAPRLQMMLILIVTGAAGFFVSYTLLRLGVIWMWLRYPIAILLAYCVFLLLLRLWLAYQQSRDLVEDLVDAADTALGVRDADRNFSVGNSNAGIGDWNETPSVPSPSSGIGEKFSVGEKFSTSEQFSVGEKLNAGENLSVGGSTGSGGFSFDFDLEDGWLVVAVILIVVACLIASLYVIYVAPALLAEILVDSLLLAGLYKKLKILDKRHWLEAAVRKTLLPVLLTAALFTAAGWLMQKAVPEARSVGEVWRYTMAGD
jgi:hypothetical protein